MGVVPLESAYWSLYIVSAVLILAEIGVVSFGMLAFNGFLAFYAAITLHFLNSQVFGVSISWSIIFSVALIEFVSIFIALFIWNKIKNIKTETGAEGMVGQKAKIVSWDGFKGKVRYEGEIWIAESEKEMDLNKDDNVSIESVGKMKLNVKA
tara:strand:- start:4597 stop:5052 length:456 start_codon:yes stop_codon:yes gene_type:complete